ncbi:2-C-methyl-D-erythritol 4-phosphate cytidylyltransferase [Colwellia sp. D2M02]|nr:2-C-methyl-D-erythritol 4-phosphate cytidylyltransferase [Colwellia sp. D2M02]
MNSTMKFIAIVPAAGVGKRMQADCPKQYLSIANKTILEHTVNKLLSHPKIEQVILSLDKNDQYFNRSPLVNHPKVIRVNGGKERVDSVLNGLRSVDNKTYPWVLVHDAARPCVSHQDIDQLITQCLANDTGGILASPVRDTMKRGCVNSANQQLIINTVEREQLWHALTPQLYKTQQLMSAIEQGLANGWSITDESSAIEQANLDSLLVAGSSENIKITHPDDLLLAEFYLAKQSGTLLNKEQQCE